MPVSDLYRVRTIFTGVPGTPWYSNQYFDEAGGTAQQAANVVKNFWSGLAAYFPTTVTATVQALVDQVDPGTNTIIGSTSTTTVSVPGGGTGQPLPWASQGNIRLRTGVYINGRQLVGRIFFPGLTQASIASGLVNGATISALNSGVAAMIADANSALVVYSRLQGRWETVVSADTAQEFAVLKSRRD